MPYHNCVDHIYIFILAGPESSLIQSLYADFIFSSLIQLLYEDFVAGKFYSNHSSDIHLWFVVLAVRIKKCMHL